MSRVFSGPLDRGLAVQFFEEAQRAVSADPAVWRNLGQALSDLGELDRAADALTKALRLSPRCADAWNDLGSVCSRKGDLAGAVAAFLDAVSLDPGDGRAWFNLAVARVRQLDPPAARQAYRRLKAADPARAEEFLGWVARESRLGAEEVLKAFEDA